MKHCQIFSTIEEESLFRNGNDYLEPLVTYNEESGNIGYNNPPKVYYFGSREISPGPLYHNGTDFEIKDSWNYCSYGSIMGHSTGSTYFNLYTISNPPQLGDWFIPSIQDWKIITGTNDGSPRNGSMVNNTPSALYAKVQLSDVSYANQNNPLGLLLFPDDETITGCTLTYINSNTVNTNITNSQINEYLSQGCVFLPACGSYGYGSWSNYNEGRYLSQTLSSSNGPYSLSFGDSYISTGGLIENSYCLVRMIRYSPYIQK